MKEVNNVFYEFSQDLVIDLQNKPHKFIDLDSLISQLESIKKEHGNCKVAIVTDRNLKFTYLHRVNKEGQVETDCLYPHKNETLGCTVHHVFIAEDSENERDDEMDRYAYHSGIMSKHNVFDYVSIECIGDNGRKYEVTITNSELIILTQNPIARDTNMKIIETFVLNDSVSDTTVNTNIVFGGNTDTINVQSVSEKGYANATYGKSKSEMSTLPPYTRSDDFTKIK